MKFLADMGVSQQVVAYLRGAGHSVIHLRDEKLERLSDELIVSKAIRESRIILTFDLDFGEILALASGAVIGVILFRLNNTRSSFIVKRLESMLRDVETPLEEGAIVVVEDARYRIRRLPIGG